MMHCKLHHHTMIVDHHRMIGQGVECTVKPALKTKGCQCIAAVSYLRTNHLKKRRPRMKDRMSLMLTQSLMPEHWKIQLKMRGQMMLHH
jgi:hypothetical protein